MTTKELNIIDNLLTRTNNLPDILHLRAAEIGYELTENEKKLLLDTYEKLDDILKEVAAFINIKFPGRQDHIHGWNKIDFDTKIGNFKIITTDLEHTKRAWTKGLFDLKSLLKSLRNEVVLLLDNVDQLNKSDKDIRANNFTGNIIYNESKVTGGQIQSSSFSKYQITKQKQDKAKVAKIINWLLLLIGGIAAIATIYQVYKQYNP
jgi:hypothetical protein